MQLKHALILLPLMWAIMVQILTFGVGSALGLSANALVSFIVSAVTIVTLSSFKILDSGLSDGANRLLFVLIFGALFYGIAVATLYVGGGYEVGTFNNGVMTYETYQDVDIDLNNIPDYIRMVVIAPTSPTFHQEILNPNYNSTAEIPEGTAVTGFGTTANTGLGNPMFIDMPYFTVINVVFGLCYMFGLYFMVSS